MFVQGRPRLDAESQQPPCRQASNMQAMKRPTVITTCSSVIMTVMAMMMMMMMMMMLMVMLEGRQRGVSAAVATPRSPANGSVASSSSIVTAINVNNATRSRSAHLS